jgi:glycosyltransferase involved in cell wall biosynthesis
MQPLTGLNIIRDNRSGTKLEIVVPTLNEERRISNLLKCYAQEFDVVLLDDGSADATVDLAIQAGATVYRRVGEGIGENHYVYYVNEMTKSGLCFYMFADEFIKKSDLRATFAALQVQPCVVLGKRVDWAYGKKLVSPVSSTPRGLSRGSAVYNPNRLHSSLEYREMPNTRFLEFDVHHLHVYSMKRYFGQVGYYAYLEVEQFRRQTHPLLRFIKRFVIFEIRRLPGRMWRERKRGLPFLIWMTVLSMSACLVGILCWIEQFFLMPPEEQLEVYAKFYVDEP